MPNLAEAILASLLLHGSSRDREVSRKDLFADIGYDRDDLRAARQRQRKRS